MKGRRFFITLEVENMDELNHIKGFVRDVLNKGPSHDSVAPPASRASGKKEEYKFFCSNPTCGAGITLKVKEFSEKEFGFILCWNCQAVVREKKAGEEPPTQQEA